MDFWKPKQFSLFGSAASLRAWEGKYPFSRVKGLQFFEVPEISVRVETALGEEAVKAMKVMSTSPDIKERDGWLIATGCTPHACVDRWSVLINLKTYDVFACLRGYFSSNSIQTEVFGGTGFQRVKHTLDNNFNEGGCAGEEGPAKFLAILSPKVAIPVPSPSQQEKAQNILSLGTGFFVAPQYLLSNNHVVADCRGPIHARYPDKPWFFAKIAGQDKANDLALLYTETESISFASFRFGPRLGDSVAAYGFPYPGVLSASGNFTMGNVTSLSGMADDTRFLQISTPVQPGNSGGPLLDMSGNVVGVVESQLNAVAVMQAEKSVPQNVNFGIQVPIVVNFLSVKGVVPKINSSDGPKLTPSDVADLAKQFTVQLYCEEDASKASGKGPKLLSRSRNME